jgi:predicted PurR-regulated permease PerM
MAELPLPFIPSGPGPRSPVHTLVLLVATGLGVFLCYLLTAPFLPAFVWAVTFAVLLAPFETWLESKLPPLVAVTLTVLTIGLVVGITVIFFGQQLVRQAAAGAELVDAKIKSGEWSSALESQPRIAAIAGWIERQINLPNVADSLAAWLKRAAVWLLTGSVAQATTFCLTFYLLFFFLRDRRAALAACRSLSPLSDAETNGLLLRVRDTIHATVYGTLAVALAQGASGGLMFWWLGLSTPLLWGFVMGFLSMVPLIGAFVVWIPAAVFLCLDGSWGKAILLTLWGALAVGAIDNVLRPFLVGNRLKLHTVLIFVSVFGGMILFGTSGLILGPVTLTITLALLGTWRGRTATTDPV